MAVLRAINDDNGNPHPTAEQQRIAELEAQVAALKTARGTLRFKVGEKGGLSVYGLGRFPVTLYRGQWERLLDSAEDIRAFIAANAERLATKE